MSRDKGESQGPGSTAVLILNPLTDDDFARMATRLMGQRGGPADLQDRLRRYYPEAVVRPRGLSGEREAWYVYRDGHWVPPQPRPGRTR